YREPAPKNNHCSWIYRPKSRSIAFLDGHKDLSFPIQAVPAQVGVVEENFHGFPLDGYPVFFRIVHQGVPGPVGTDVVSVVDGLDALFAENAFVNDIWMFGQTFGADDGKTKIVEHGIGLQVPDRKSVV